MKWPHLGATTPIVEMVKSGGALKFLRILVSKNFREILNPYIEKDPIGPYEVVHRDIG